MIYCRLYVDRDLSVRRDFFLDRDLSDLSDVCYLSASTCTFLVPFRGHGLEYGSALLCDQQQHTLLHASAKATVVTVMVLLYGMWCIPVSPLLLWRRYHYVFLKDGLLALSHETRRDTSLIVNMVHLDGHERYNYKDYIFGQADAAVFSHKDHPSYRS